MNKLQDETQGENCCANCGARKGCDGSELMRCSKCLLVSYCSRACQIDHWKNGEHKGFCIAPVLSKLSKKPVIVESEHAEISEPVLSTLSDKPKIFESQHAEVVKLECVICQDDLKPEESCTLPFCTHTFHKVCVANIRKFGVNEVCPLCRAPLYNKKVDALVKLYTLVLRRSVDVGIVITISDNHILTKLFTQLEGEATLGDKIAQCVTAEMCFTGRGTAEDLPVAANWYRKAAEQGVSFAQTTLALMLMFGNGIQKNEAEAVTWYRKAGQQGEKQAQYELGLIFDKGSCAVAKNEVEALKWIRKSSEQGYADAQFRLGMMLLSGCGVVRNETQASNWHRKAAEQGARCAQFQLGVLLQQGRGVVKNEIEAAKWYRLAAEQGLFSAQFNLGLMLEQGRGVAKDETEALKWFRKAAEQGNPKAQLKLSDMLDRGLGVPNT